MKPNLYPCAKNGKFLGYATKEQIENYKSLSIFDPVAAKSDKPKSDPVDPPSIDNEVEENQANPDQVKRSPKGRK